MESQLPRLKARPLGINTSHNIKKPTTSKSTVVKASDLLSKSTSAIVRGSMKENKPPLEDTLGSLCTKSTTVKTSDLLSKSISNIARGSMKENKQPAEVTLGSSCTKSATAKPCLWKITDPSCSTAVSQGGKKASKISPMLENSMNSSKPKKWDLKGRLDATNAELIKYKKMLKESKNLDKVIDELCLKETESNTHIEQLEKTIEILHQDIYTEKKRCEDTIKNSQEMNKKFEESQLSKEKVSKALEERQEECNSQKKVIYKDVEKLNNLKNTLNDYKLNNWTLSKKIRDLQLSADRIDNEKRILHNAIQEIKGNIRVFCRVRPQLPKENLRAVSSMNFLDEYTIGIAHAESLDLSNHAGNKSRTTKQEFSFDKIFPPTSTQAEIFEELSLLVQSALEGYNVCVFAYGQTGSGKTYTMEGGDDSDTEGMIPRTVRQIFNGMKQLQRLGWQYKVQASFLEIYNEHIVDLLDFRQNKNHEIRMADSKGNDLYVTNLLIAKIDSPEELFECFRTARENRAVAATQSNERSSRSHFVTRIQLIGEHASRQERSIGNLNLIDLAGSERLKNDKIARNIETKNINKSLANLGNVILALSKKQDHVPYRNSKLTHLLMPSLGGNSKTLMILNVSPLEDDFHEIISSLRFASSVKSCKIENVKRSRTPTSTVI